MIPTFNCANYLEITLKSVLAQDPGEELMQIEVIDDCSTLDNPEEIINRFGKGRVKFFRQEGNVGATENFNTCIKRAKGELVHILHGDDWLENGFYAEIERLVNKYPDSSLYATRSFFSSERGSIQLVTPELPELEEPSNNITSFFYTTPIQFSGIVVRNTFFQNNPTFDKSLVHTADVDMWTRVIFKGGGVVSNKVLSHYRVFAQNDTSKLKKTAGNLIDYLKLGEKFAKNYTNFNPAMFSYMLQGKAFSQVLIFAKSGDMEAANSNFKFFIKHSNIKGIIKFILREPLLFLRLLTR